MKLPLDTGEYHLVAALEHRGNSQQSGHYQTVVLTAHGWQRRNDGMLEEQCAYDAVPRLNEQDIYLLAYARPNLLEIELQELNSFSCDETPRREIPHLRDNLQVV